MVVGVGKKSKVATMDYMMALLLLGSTVEWTGKNFVT